MSQDNILLSLIQNDAGTVFAATKGWLPRTNVCDWYGIACNDGGKVTSLGLTGYSLQATLVSQLGQLTDLEDLVLTNCGLRGSIPKEIAALPELHVVDLSFNQLTGPVPIFAASSLTLLSYARNKLTGSIPPLLMGMPELITLDYKFNQLTGSIPEDFTDNLQSLQELDLSQNQLTGLIPSKAMDNLERLYVNNNRITGYLPDVAAPRLQELHINSNQVTGTLPTSLAQLFSLEVLLVDDNRLTGEVPQELCRLDLNDFLFDDEPSYQMDQGEIYGGRRIQHTTQRDGCTSIACPAGYRSLGDNGVFPCAPCDNQLLNPYLGANQCRDITQEKILEILYNATNGSNWTGGNIGSWADPSVPICSKAGIICDNQGNVLRLILKNRNMSGTLPLEIGFLSEMIELDLSNNNLNGRLPEELAIAPLKRLDVSENQFTGYVPGALCRKAGTNGNGQESLFNCDTIACPMATFHPQGRADPGLKGMLCKPCSLVNGHVLGNTNCGTHPVDHSQTQASAEAIPWTANIVLFILLGAGIVLGAILWNPSINARVFASRARPKTYNNNDDETKKNIRLDVPTTNHQIT